MAPDDELDFVGRNELEESGKALYWGKGIRSGIMHKRLKTLEWEDSENIEADLASPVFAQRYSQQKKKRQLIGCWRDPSPPLNQKGWRNSPVILYSRFRTIVIVQ